MLIPSCNVCFSDVIVTFGVTHAVVWLLCTLPRRPVWDQHYNAADYNILTTMAFCIRIYSIAQACAFNYSKVGCLCPLHINGIRHQLHIMWKPYNLARATFISSQSALAQTIATFISSQSALAQTWAIFISSQSALAQTIATFISSQSALAQTRAVFISSQSALAQTRAIVISSQSALAQTRGWLDNR